MNEETAQTARLLSYILIAEHNCNQAVLATGNCLANMPQGVCTEKEIDTFFAAARQLTTAIYAIEERVQTLINGRENNDHKQNNPGEAPSV